MTITTSNYLDFRNLIINELIGDVGLTLLLGYIFITWYCVKRRIPLQAIIAINFIFTALIMTYQYLSSVWTLVVIIIALLAYVVYDKFYRR